jgi:hypothetical protein
MPLRIRSCTLALCCLSLLATVALSKPAVAENKVLGELELAGSSDVERSSGVWIDEQYLGYLKELKGSKKILLLPGTHKVSVRQNGYQDFTREVTLQPGEKQLVTVTMVKAPGYVMPAVTSEIKMSINPDRAAVFLDGQFVGHAAEFGGIGRSLIVAPGHRKISITLPGYNTFNTEIDLAPNQKFVLKTDLVKSGSPEMQEPK